MILAYTIPFIRTVTRYLHIQQEELASGMYIIRVFYILLELLIVYIIVYYAIYINIMVCIYFILCHYFCILYIV